MGNQICVECLDCLHEEKILEKKDTDIKFCLYPFCNLDLSILDDKSLFVEFNDSVYCSSMCRLKHKRVSYIGKYWNK